MYQLQAQPAFTCSKSSMEKPKQYEICSKVNNKNKRTSLTSFWCLYCKLWTDFALFSDVLIVHFEQVNPRWAASVKRLIPPFPTDHIKKHGVRNFSVQSFYNASENWWKHRWDWFSGITQWLENNLVPDFLPVKKLYGSQGTNELMHNTQSKILKRKKIN